MEAAVVLVLVVEDEPLIREMLEHALGDGGFAVTLAASGEEALTLIEGETFHHQALVTDIRLAPGKASGWDVARRARERNPQLAVVYMTGDSAADWAAQGVPNSILVQKPFAPAQILSAVAQLLNAASSTPAAPAT